MSEMTPSAPDHLYARIQVAASTWGTNFESALVNEALAHATRLHVPEATLLTSFMRMVTSWKLLADADPELSEGQLAARARSLESACAVPMGGHTGQPSNSGAPSAASPAGGTLPAVFQERLESAEGYALVRAIDCGRVSFTVNKHIEHALTHFDPSQNMNRLNRGELMNKIIYGYDAAARGNIGALLGRKHVEAALAGPDADGWLWAREGSTTGAPITLKCYDRSTGMVLDHKADAIFCIHASGTHNRALLLLTPQNEGFSSWEKDACLRGSGSLF